MQRVHRRHAEGAPAQLVGRQGTGRGSRRCRRSRRPARWGRSPSAWPGRGWWGRPATQVPVRSRTSRRHDLLLGAGADRGDGGADPGGEAPAAAVRPTARPGPVPSNGSAGRASSTVASTRRARSSVSPSVSAATTRARAPSSRPRSSAPRVRVSTRHNRRAAWTSRSACQRARPVAAATSSAAISSRSCTSEPAAAGGAPQRRQPQLPGLGGVHVRGDRVDACRSRCRVAGEVGQRVRPQVGDQGAAGVVRPHAPTLDASTKNAIAWFAERGVTVQRVISDNGSCYRVQPLARHLRRARASP